MKKWRISYTDAAGDGQFKLVDAIDVYMAITIAAVPYNWITAVSLAK